MKRRWIQLSVLLISVLCVTGLSRSTSAAPGVGGSSCVSNSDCIPPAGLVCNYETGADYRTCQSLSISVSAPTVTASSISTVVHQNANGTMQVYGCLGKQSTCSAVPTSNTDVWTLLGSTSGVNSAFTATMNNLRAGRTYTMTIAGVESGSTAYAQVAAATTWPGTPPTPTDAHVACDGGTQLCSRRITWTTPFAGDSRVVYTESAASSWQLASNNRDTSSNFAGLTTSPSGKIWGVGYGGKIALRDAAGFWTAQTSPMTYMLYATSAGDDNNVWAVGQNGYALRTQNGGATWSGPVTIQAGISFLSVFASTAQTAWAAGGSTVYQFNGATWVQKNNDPTTSFNDVVSLDNIDAWVVGTNGAIRHTTNGFQAWGGATPPNWIAHTTSANDNLLSIATLDGQTLWTGGFNTTAGGARLYRSVDSGTTWSELPQLRSISSGIDNIIPIDKDTIWFSTGYSVGKLLYNNGNPQVTVYSQLGAQLGSSVFSLAIPKGNEIVAGGEQQNISSFTMPSTSNTLTNPASTTSHSVVLPDLAPNTTYHYAVESTGSGVTTGNFGGSFTTPLIDQSPPTVSINAIPAAVRTCPLTISGTASDNVGVVSVNVSLDGTPLGTATGTTSWSMNIPCGSLPNGNHTVSVTAFDGTNTSAPVTATFLFDATNPTVTITPQGPVTTATVTVAGTAQDNDQVAAVDIAVNSGPRTPVSITAGANISWSAANVTLTGGANAITVYATDRAGNEGVANTTIIYNVPTFTLSATSATTVQVNAGDAATYNLRLTSVNTFAGAISFTAAGGPPSHGFSLNPTSPLTLNSGATLNPVFTVTTIGTDVGGPYTMTVTATSGTIVRTLTLTIGVDVAADFTLSSSPSSQTVVAGGDAVYNLALSGSSTFVMQPGGFTITTGTLPFGVTSTFSALSGNASNGGTATLTLTLHTTAASPVTNASIDLTADDTVANVHTIQLQLTATPPPDFSLSFAAASASVTAGPATAPTSTTFINATVTALNGYNGTVSLAFDSTPSDTAHIHTTVSPATVTPSVSGTTVTVNIQVDSGVGCDRVVGTPCTYAIRLVGTPSVGGVSQKIATANLVVTPDTTGPTITNTTASPDYNTVSISWLTSEPADSQVTIYSDATHANVVGTAFDPVLCTGSCHALNITPLNPLTTYYYSVTSVDGAFSAGNSVTIYDDGTGPLQFTTTAAPDLTQPLFVFDAPGNGTEIIGTTQVTGHASDNSPLDHISLTITLNGSATPLVDQQFPCSSPACSFTYTWNSMQSSPTFPNGDYTLTAWAVSTTGRVTPTINYAESVHAARTVTVNNDTSAPQVLCLSGQTGVCQPQARNLVCTNGLCQVTIVWRTDDASTSEVEYGLSTNCSQYKVRPDGTSVPCTYTSSQRYDDLDPFNGNPIYTDHSITLTNLLPDQLYHYRITSCNISNLCTN